MIAASYQKQFQFARNKMFLWLFTSEIAKSKHFKIYYFVAQGIICAATTSSPFPKKLVNNTTYIFDELISFPFQL